MQFLCLYRGSTIEDSDVIAVSANPRLIRNFAESLVDEDDFKDAVRRELLEGLKEDEE